MTETQPVNSGQKNQYGLIPAIEDYLAFEYIPSVFHTIEMNLGNTGDNLRIFKDASIWVNTIYQQATNPSVKATYDGTASTSGIGTAAQQAYHAIFGGTTDKETLYYKFNEFVMNSGKLSFSLYTNLKQVLDDLGDMASKGTTNPYTATSTTSDQNSAYATWYGGKEVQENLIGAIYATESISVRNESKLREIMFLYEMYIKSASSLLSNVDQSAMSLAINIRST